MKKTILIAVMLFSLSFPKVYAQEVKGILKGHPQQAVYLYGYSNFDSYVIDSTSTDKEGKFSLVFSAKDYGMGYIQPGENKPYILVLADETIELTGQAIDLTETTSILRGKQNKAFAAYATEHPKRQNALSAWEYLKELYTEDPTFSDNKKQRKAILDEIQRIKAEDQAFIASLPEDSYVRWFLPIRQLLGSVASVAQYRTDEIPATRKALREMNLADDRFYKSGLLNEAVENHIWFIENSSGDLDQVFADLNQSTEIIIEQLKEDNEKFNLIAQRMFNVFEKRSLFNASEYLSKRLLEGDDCGCLNQDFEKQLNTYGKMTRGATAPNISFTQYTYFPEGMQAKTLSDIEADYYLVVFAGSWCGHCTKAMPKLAELYPNLKAKNIETVLVSLEENINEFAKFAGSLPFISTTELQKWDAKATEDYQVYSTPSYFMLDKDRTILMKLKSVEHIGAWIEYAMN